MQNLPVRYSADLYDLYSERFLFFYDAMLMLRLEEVCRQDAKTGVLLDIGAGTGRFLARLAGQAGFHEMRFVGLDFFPDMVLRARQTIESLGMSSRIQIVRGDAHRLPFADNSIDLVVSRSTLHHLADPVCGLGEIHRILKPNQLAVIHEPRRDPSPAVLSEFNRMREQAGVSPTILDEKYTADEVRNLLAQAGLESSGVVTSPEHGIGSIGMEILIRKEASA